LVKNKEILASYLSLFTSTGTIFCCALPALLVSLGLGATFAGLVGAFPQIVWLSENKIIVFSISGIMITLSIVLTYYNRNASCPIDPVKAQACKVSRKWSIRILIFSVSMWLVGFFFAFLAPIILI